MITSLHVAYVLYAYLHMRMYSPYSLTGGVALRWSQLFEAIPLPYLALGL